MSTNARTGSGLPLAVIVSAALILALADAWPASQGIGPAIVAVVMAAVIAGAATVPLVSGRDTWAGAGPSTARVARRLLIAGLSLLVALAAAEFATRVVFRDITTTGDNRGFFTRRWQRRDASTTNSAGFREREFAAAKAPGRLRIAVVGDSFTYGNGIPSSKRYTDLLTDLLPPEFEVLNFGTSGHNTPDHTTTIRRQVRATNPDFVLVQWFVNDVEGNNSKGRPVYAPLVPWPALDQWLYRSSALYTIANTAFSQWQAGHPGRSYEDYVRSRFTDPDGEGARQDRQAMEDLADECRRDRLPLGIVLFPDAGYDLGSDYPFGFLHRRVMDFCAERGLTCLDLRPVFAAEPDRRRLWVNRFDRHPSAEANRVAADHIAGTFLPIWTALRPAGAGPIY